MGSDAITDEIRSIRRDLAAQFGNDLDLILADIRKREASDGRTYVSLPPRITSRKPDEPSHVTEPAVGPDSHGESSAPAR
jgi:hypothetical protein